ncbi:precorrin-6y C5,15-methyltransferase (decarboxylating) subunit CbiE [Tumebacillus sp. ITR2]|uniref:Precorrin-6y C5,15-methyltransferase (Decarboxylating) subunit CbiE n=1 Tax=Tumebacillus amylolyticus TaxID=2801339 RepID=A0ABS1J6A5_9BACL|nr:precorrin-6y C5,15-methyltransferase (decarboxylating) subunit CbiE [Tumebacillus amylolyticus]
MNEIHVIGIGDDGAAGLFPAQRELVEKAGLLIGGARHLRFFPEFAGETYIITGKLTELVDVLHEKRAQNIVVLASGDPMFYGIGAYLSKKVPGLTVHPHLSSIQLAFARAGLGWQDAHIDSLHGKSIKGLAQRLDGKPKVALLTDDTNTPATIAWYLQHYGMTEYEMVVAENLGSGDDRVRTFKDLHEVEGQEFSPLNVVLLLHKREARVPRWTLGIEDEDFAQRKPDKGLITKREVRVLSLSELNLRPDSIVWDIGTCTASVAIEAAKLANLGRVYAIEKNEADLENAEQNAQKFRTDLHLYHGKAPEFLDTWPDPDAVFIGGSGGEMSEVLRLASERLRPQGRIVLNAATIETLYDATQTFAKLGMTFRVTLLQTARSKPILNMTRFEGLNPIYIITAWQTEVQEKEGDA